MKVTIAAVCSADGYMTQGTDQIVRHWASEEDAARFLDLINRHQLVVMGRNTYEAVRPKPQPERLRIVLTSRPARSAAFTVPGQLEFQDASPQTLAAAMEARGFDAMLVVGGGQVNAAFLQAGLVDELWITIEPVLFGSGTPMLGNLPCTTELRLLSTEQLNDRGTLLLHYQATRQS